MDQIEGSRRTFVGAAVAGGALLGAMAFTRWGAVAPMMEDEDISFRQGGVPGFSPDVREVGRWEQAVGSTVRIAGEAGSVALTLARLTAEPVVGKRPAGLRTAPFALHFDAELAGAPAGDRIYDLAQPIAGATRMFLKRGADRLGRATLIADFN